MRNSWKLWTTIGAGLLVIAGPAVTTAGAADVPSPQSGTSTADPDAPQNAYNPGAQANGGQAGVDSAGGAQTGSQINDAPAKPQSGRKGAPQAGRKGTQPNVQDEFPSTGQPAPTYRNGRPETDDTTTNALPAERAGKQTPAAAADPSFPADPNMPSAGNDGSDMNMPNVTAPGQGPGPVGGAN